jgi:hypothetical protein
VRRNFHSPGTGRTQHAGGNRQRNLAQSYRRVTPVIAGSLDMSESWPKVIRRKSALGSGAGKMGVPLKATDFHATEHLLEHTSTMLDDSRREQNNNESPAHNWLTNNITLEIICAKVAANKANAILNV